MTRAISDQKELQLGMPFGTAMARLRKMVLFSVLERHGENVCYRCGQLIANHADLSLEHIKPWLHAAPELFWQLENLAFSHLSCNIKASRCGRNSGSFNSLDNPTPPKVGPKGTAWCAMHKSFLPIGRFTKDASKLNGVYVYCRECRRSYRQSRKLEHPAGIEPA